MRSTADYSGRIARALALIERSVAAETPPSLAALAAEAAMSHYHFHRIYRVLTGETPQQTLTRARLGGSLPALQSPGGIAEGAGRSGYASTQSYGRALKGAVGASPSELCADPARFAEAVAALSRPPGDAPLAIEIVELEPLTLLARRTVGPYDELNQGYHRLFELALAAIAPEDVTGLYGLPYDDPRACPPAECRFDCAITTAVQVAPHDELRNLAIAGGPALRLTLAGDYDRAHDALDALYALAIAHDLPLADAQPLFHYHHDPEEVAEEELRADLYLLLA